MSAAPGERTAREFAARRHGALIERETVSTGSGSVAVLNPATEEELAEVPLADAGTVDVAVVAADAAFRDQRWSRLDPVAQERVLRRLAELIERHADELAWLETLDNGKPLIESGWDVGGSARVFSYYAGWPTKLRGEVHSTDRRFLALSAGNSARAFPAA